MLPRTKVTISWRGRHWLRDTGKQIRGVFDTATSLQSTEACTRLPSPEIKRMALMYSSTWQTNCIGELVPHENGDVRNVLPEIRPSPLSSVV